MLDANICNCVGPEYNFPGNCYSEKIVQNPSVLQSMAKAHSMIGAAEELLWPAERVVSDLAIIQPRSSALWDMHGIDVAPLVKVGKSIGDCTNNEFIAGSVDYYAETYGIYNALAVAMNRPTDFIDETALLDANLLSRFKVLVLTEPNVPLKELSGLLEWVKDGGTLITVPGAASMDQYNEPSDVLAIARGGMLETPQDRLIISSWGYRLGTGKAGCRVPAAPACKNGSVPGVVANGTLGADIVGSAAPGPFHAWGRVSTLETPANSGKMLASFSDGSPAIVSNPIGSGKNVHFLWFPGLSHAYEAIENFGHLEPSGINPFPGMSNGSRLTTEIALHHILDNAGSKPRVTCDASHVETPLLEASKGTVVTVLNWLNTTQKAGPQSLLLTCNISLGFVPVSVVSTEEGPINELGSKSGTASSGWWTGSAFGDVTVRITVAAADILNFHKV